MARLLPATLLVLLGTQTWLPTSSLLDSTGTGGPIPKGFDCDVRKLAYSYGKQLLPRYGKFESLFYALGLDKGGCAGKLTPGPAAPPTTPPATTPPPHSHNAVFVDPLRGVDSHEGTEQRPKRTLHVALQAALTQQSKEVVLREGVHYLDRTLELSSEHSDLILRSYPGENSIVSGGVVVKPQWRPYKVAKGSNIYVATLPKTVREVPGLHVGGVRATRARYPNLPAGIEVSPGYGSMIAGGKATWTPPQLGRYGHPTQYVDESPGHLRNVTAGDWWQRYTTGTNGQCSVYDPPVSFWCSEKTKEPPTFQTPAGLSPKAGSLPNAPYADTSQITLFVWRPYRWANWMFQVANYTVTPEAPLGNFTFGHGGFQGARGDFFGGDWFVENVFEELDHPGEFFFNETTGELYLWYNSTGTPPEDLEVVVPKLDVLVNLTGSQWKPVRNVTIDGVTFTASRYTYMHPHGVPSGGDWALERIGAVFLEGTEDVTLQNCNFSRLDGHGVLISGYNRNATVQDSSFEFIGGSAMASWGYTNETANSGFPFYRPQSGSPQAGVDGTDGNHPLNNRILGNVAREVGLYEKQNSFYVQAKTAQSKISGNVFFNGPRAGINANDGFGGGDEISHNLVFSTCRESGDHGPFNSWDRQPYLTEVRTGKPSMIMEWRQIHHNFLMDNYSPQENVDNDDGSSYYRTHHNFLVYGRRAMKTAYGGHDNQHFNNIYAYAGTAFYLDKTTLPGHESYFYNNRVVLTGGNVGQLACKPPHTQTWENEYYTPNGQMSECGHSLADAQAMGLETGSTVDKLPAGETVLAWAKELLQIQDSGELEGEIII